MLMRHGQTGSNVTGALDTGTPGAALTALGLRQATGAVPHLIDRGVVAAYSSHLSRARQTAAAVSDHLGLATVVHEGLAEIGAGELEMRADPSSVRTYVETMLSWIAGELSPRMPGGEDGHEFLHRYDEAVAHVHAHAQRAGHHSVLVVSHGAAMGTWLRHRSTNLQEWSDIGRFRNTGIAVMDGEPGALAIREWVSGPLAGPDLDEPDALGAPAQVT